MSIRGLRPALLQRPPEPQQYAAGQQAHKQHRRIACAKQWTSWNALAIRGLAIVAALDRPDLVEAATRATEFLQKTMFVDGRLLASYKDGEARLPVILDDHVLLDAWIELLQALEDGAFLSLPYKLPN